MKNVYVIIIKIYNTFVMLLWPAINNNQGNDDYNTGRKISQYLLVTGNQ